MFGRARRARIREWLAGRDDLSRAGLPVNEVLSPLPLAALAVLVLNDWWLKPSIGASYGWLTGKLSDVAGLLLAPLVLTATVDLLLYGAYRSGAHLDPSLRRWKLAAACGTTGAVFVAVKLSSGAATWVAEVWSHAWPGAAIVADPTDLAALPALLLAGWHGRRTIGRVPYARLRWAIETRRRGAAPIRTLDDVRACGGDATRVARLEAAISEQAGDARADAALRALRAA